MRNANQPSTQNQSRIALRKEYESYEEYLEALFPRPEEGVILDSEDPIEFGSELAEMSLRKLEKRLARN
jgi:hypothetical protein